MNLFKKLLGLGAAPAPGSTPGGYEIVVQCQRCGEAIRARVNLANDLSVEYDEAGNEAAFVCRKVLMGQGRCFQPIEVTLKFDANRNVMDRQIAGGTIVEG